MSSTRPRNLNAEQMYKLAHDALTQGNYTRAIKLFETLEARFPYGRYAQQAILELAYANYRAGETAAAVAACDRFIRTFPNNQNRRLRLLSRRASSTSARTRDCWVTSYELDLAEREPKGMRESFAAFKELVAKISRKPLRAQDCDRPDALSSRMRWRSTK